MGTPECEVCSTGCDLNDVDAFIKQYGGFTESYWFYNRSVELRYAPKEHIYYKVMPTGQLEAQSGVTSVSGILDKSNALIPWACKMMAQEILEQVPHDTTESLSQAWISPIKYADFEALILAAKSAHKKKLDHASFVGNLAHDWIEQFIKYELNSSQGIPYIPLPANEQAKNCCQAAIKWMRAHNVRWIYTEKKVYSIGYGYAGTMDGLCLADSCEDPQCCRSKFADKLCLADWKSSNELRVEYLLQTAAYQHAYEEEYGEMIYARWVIRLGKEDGEFEPWFIDTIVEDWLAFRHALGLSRSIDKITQRMKDHEAILRQERKEQKKQAREAALTLKCKGADRYQGKRQPRCNGGNPCESCTNKYRELHPS